MNQSQHQTLPMFSDVVIVQSENILREVMCEAFSGIGARVYAFSTADEAMAHLLSGKKACALVVTDQRLEGQLQGEDLLELVNDKWPAVMAIIISGYRRETTMLPDGTAFLQKPWVIDQLITTATSLRCKGCHVE